MMMTTCFRPVSKIVFIRSSPISQVFPLHQQWENISSRIQANKYASRRTGISCHAQLLQEAHPQETRQPQETSCVAEKVIVEAALHLQEHGWAVIPNVLPSDTCTWAVEHCWNWLEALGTGINRNDSSTWGDDRWPPNVRGILNSLASGHQDFAWAVRKHASVQGVFSRLWGTNELLSSFDSVNVLRPGSVTSEAAAASWMHVDQAPTRKGFRVIQGIVNLVDVGPDTGTLVVKDATHLAHQEFFKQSSLSEEEKAGMTDFFVFRPEDLPFWESYKNVQLSGPAGSLFLWDSRTVHANLLPVDGKKFRFVVYASYQPKSLATPQDLEIKRRAYQESLVTTHWAAENVRLFPESGPSYYMAAGSTTGLPKFNRVFSRDAVEDDSVLRLAGLKEYEQPWKGKGLLECTIEELREMLK